MLFEIATLSPGFAVDEDPGAPRRAAAAAAPARAPAPPARAAADSGREPAGDPPAVGRRVSELVYRERPAAGEPSGLLVLHHGRGADEHDLLPTRRRARPGAPAARGHAAGAADPARLARLSLVRGAAGRLPGARDVRRPPAASWPPFTTSCGSAPGSTHRRTVLGGFSMGTVMSYALGLSADRPAPAGILAFSGFIPTVSGWEPSLADRAELRAFIAHGRLDPVIGVEFGRRPAEAAHRRPGSRSSTTSPTWPTRSIRRFCPPPPAGWHDARVSPPPADLTGGSGHGVSPEATRRGCHRIRGSRH